jgi:hypothetical protein
MTKGAEIQVNVNRSIPCRGISSALAALAVCLAPVMASAEPSVGDTAVYRLVNGYNGQVRGHLENRVDKVDASSITVTVTPDSPHAGSSVTKLFTKDGNWLRHPVESHGIKVMYKFSTAYPAYVYPLEPGQAWSVRVNASIAGERKARSVRVDGKALQAERIRVPAGEFDTVKIRRLVYPGDSNYDQMETQIIEFEWYAPALKRAVRLERRSEWIDPGRCGMITGCDFHGDWDILELVEVRAAPKQEKVTSDK